MGKHARILVVDDDENIRKVVIAILEDEGYIVESAATAKEAIEKISEDIKNKQESIGKELVEANKEI